MQVTLAEAAALLGLRSRSTLYRLKEDGILDRSNYLRGTDRRWRIELEPPGLEPFQQWAAIVIGSQGPVRQSEAAAPASVAGDGVPDFAVSRARSEAERARLLELERLEREGALLDRAAAEAAIAQAVAIAKTRLLGVPSRLKCVVPRLSVEEVGILSDLIREALEEVSSGALLPQAGDS